MQTPARSCTGCRKYGAHIAVVLRSPPLLYDHVVLGLLRDIDFVLLLLDCTAMISPSTAFLFRARYFVSSSSLLPHPNRRSPLAHHFSISRGALRDRVMSYFPSHFTE